MNKPQQPTKRNTIITYIVMVAVCIAVGYVVTVALINQFPLAPNIELWRANFQVTSIAVLIIAMVAPILYFAFMTEQQQCPQCQMYDRSYLKRKTCPYCGANYKLASFTQHKKQGP